MRTWVVTVVLALSPLISDLAIAEPPLAGYPSPLVPGMLVQMPEPSTIAHVAVETETSRSVAHRAHSHRNAWIIPVAVAIYILVLYATIPHT